MPRHTLKATLALNLLLLVGASLLSSSRPGGAVPAPPPPAPPARPLSLHLRWVRDEQPLSPTWPDQLRFTSDAAYRPVQFGGLAFVASSRADSLTALAADSGAVRWTFRAHVPVRFAP